MTAFNNQQAIIAEDKIQEDITDATANDNGKKTDTVLSVENISSSTGTNTDSEVNGVAPQRGMILPFTPLTMSFDSINYYVDMPSVRILISIFIFRFTIYSNMKKEWNTLLSQQLT